MNCISKFVSTHLLNNRIVRRFVGDEAANPNGQRAAERFFELDAALSYIPGLGLFDLRAQVLRAVEEASWAADRPQPVRRRRSFGHRAFGHRAPEHRAPEHRASERRASEYQASECRAAHCAQPEEQTSCEHLGTAATSATPPSFSHCRVQRRFVLRLATILEEKEPSDDDDDVKSEPRHSEHQTQAGNHWRKAPTGRATRSFASKQDSQLSASPEEAWWTLKDFATPLAANRSLGTEIRKHTYNEVFPGKQQPIKKLRFDTALVRDVIPEVVKKVHFDTVPVEIPDVNIVRANA